MAEERMNLAALQQRDPYISEIIDTASQVALYLFNAKTNVWEKLSIAGSLFIYKRSASPENGFMILNRLGLNNLVEPITRYLEFQRQDSFLLYRNIKEQVIYGVWFYEQEECKRFEQQLTRYVQIVMETEKKKVSPTPSQVPEARKELITTGLGAGVLGAGVLGAGAQVDIMQMLSKAHLEYNTQGPGEVKKKTEPKPMIDNPNAAATKKSNIIRPMPLKMPDTDQPEDESKNAGTATPGTAPINLDALFRTASLQQEVSGSPRSILHRQTSVPAASKSKGDYLSESKQSTQEGLPPLLKQIMSTGSMVEDIERQHMDDSDKTDTDIGTSSLHVGMPDVSQPPPGHPAYRGPSPREQKSPRGIRGTGGRKEKGRQKGGGDDKNMDMLSKDPVKFSVPGPGESPQIVAGNLMPQFFELSTSHSSQITTHSEQSISSQIKSHDNISPRGNTIEVKDKSEPLLTPADLIQSSSNISTTSSVSVQAAGNKPLNTSLAAVAGPALSTELLSPMAFLSARKTPPAFVQEKSVIEERPKDSNPLPIAPLTKEQLQQAMLYLIKNDSGFVSQLHEAYLKSLQELSGHKT